MLVRVTDILSYFDPAKLYYTKSGREWGGAVHKAIELYLMNSLKENLDDKLKTYLNAFIDFQNYYKFQILYFEKRFNGKYYTGKPDLVMRLDNKIILVDYKSGGINPLVILQLGAYFGLINDKLKTLKFKDRVKEAWVLKLSENKFKIARVYKKTELKEALLRFNQGFSFSQYLNKIGIKKS